MTCQLVKINEKGRKDRKSASPALRPGDVVSMDIKFMPTVALGGFKYLLCFVDHASKFCMDIPLRDKESKTVVQALHKFVLYLLRHGHPVKNIQTDRGSEFFAYQDGEYKEEDLTQMDKNELLGQFTKACKQISIKHTVIPTASHEKHAEAHFSWLSKSMDCMLYDARLSPIFWADAAVYACYLHNRIPCLKSGATPYTRVTGTATDWNHIRKFGSSVVWKLPNDKHAKHPGVPRGQHMIFVGFSDLSSGFKLFDPLTRKYISGAEHVNFYEDMAARQDSLRHFDRRRAILRAKEKQPLIIDDNEINEVDRLSIEAIRNIYIDPDEVDINPVMPISDEDVLNDKSPKEKYDPENPHQSAIEAIKAGVGRKVDSEQEEEEHEIRAAEKQAKKAQKKIRKRRKKELLKAKEQAVDVRRPLRLVLPGVRQKRKDEDNEFIEAALKNDFKVKYQQKNPKKKGDPIKDPKGKESWRRYEVFKRAETLKEALGLGGSKDRIKDDYELGYIQFPGRESRQPGHVFVAASEEEATDLLSILGAAFDMDIEKNWKRETEKNRKKETKKNRKKETKKNRSKDFIGPLKETEVFSAALSSAERAAEGVTDGLRKSFNEVIATCYDPEITM